MERGALMAGKIFRDRMGKDGLEKGTSYKPGEHCYDLGLVSEIVERCENVLLGERDELVDFIKSAVPKQIDTIEHFDQNAFLEAIVLGWRQNVDYNNLHFALTHSIEALHSTGVDTFTIDFRTVPGQLFVMFSRLKGSEDHPITIACKGNFRQFGSRAEYCNLDIGGYVESFAQGAKFSELRFSGQHGAPFASGWDAEDSAYYLSSMKGLPFTIGQRYAGVPKPDRHCARRLPFTYVFIHGYNSQEFQPLSGRCRFYVESFDEGLFRQMEINGFWHYENRLYVPNGEGGWNERIPNGSGSWREVPEG